MNKEIIDTFEIPEDIAKELSELLIKQNIRERVLATVAGEPDKYNEIEKSLIPIVGRIEAIKSDITIHHVPAKYRKDEYSWNFNGYDVSGCYCQIMKN